MTILVQNCFHWIGYHYVNFLLEKGIVVKGIDKINSDKKDNLAMFFGRNSSFQWFEDSYDEKVSTALIIGNRISSIPINADRIIQIVLKQTKKIPDAVTINAPLLFGEWMEMTNEGVTDGNRIIPFQSDEFLQDAIYIEDFILSTYPLFESNKRSGDYQVISNKMYLDDAVKLENSIYIRDNIPMKHNVKKVIEHYKRYQNFY
ncbi:hypothetical protein [Ornithinibacillus halotolerans]|uniref:Uncharacterized protein n=1 Tax=Ornithinibacillus halotolerans TaxID=1274357 RepID=A0A916RWQ5_9BACI|nr:hypothetical protein [Ornithinibacillus halotolerans]GGA73926.1 hypothetical protein GCM10008025_17060 [Ornithinibacillus halotolerans]